ncbi:hypothetical protein REC_156 [Pseudomonas phage REC]|nr:hypothetical protein REC_156 [Pseudomonas phage REC]UGL62560.1 hypothetical protein [Pseudomonas phage REC1]
MVFDQPKMDIGEDVFTIKEFASLVNCGAFIPDDGSGHWGNETHFTWEGSVWSATSIPEGATHVHWFNK